MDESEKKYTIPLLCGHCGNMSPMLIGVTYRQKYTCEIPAPKFSDFNLSAMGYVESEFDEIYGGYEWELSVCPSCDGVILRRFVYEMGDDLCDHIDIVFPMGNNPINGLPVQIQKAYDAALRVSRIDSNAFAALLGRVIDLICEEKSAKGRFLGNRIADLAEKDIIPEQLGKMAHKFLQLRNIGAHASLGELTPDEVPILGDLCKAILEYVYTIPALIEQAQKRIDNLKVGKNP